MPTMQGQQSVETCCALNRYNPQAVPTHHLLVLLQQRTGQAQLGAGVDRRQGDPGGCGAHKLHHSRLQRREGVGDAGLVPH